MKRVGFLYDKIYELDNIKLAIMKASLGKRDQKRVVKVLNNIDYYAKQIQDILKAKTYVPSPYIIKTIYDAKKKKCFANTS